MSPPCQFHNTGFIYNIPLPPTGPFRDINLLSCIQLGFFVETAQATMDSCDITCVLKSRGVDYSGMLPWAREIVPLALRAGEERKVRKCFFVFYFLC